MKSRFMVLMLKSVFETVHQHPILHFERIGGNWEVIRQRFVASPYAPETVLWEVGTHFEPNRSALMAEREVYTYEYLWVRRS